MSNLETRPVEIVCGEPIIESDEPPGPTVEVLTAREVPLGGVRAMRVRRTLPQRARSLIGAWCFADNYGPEEVTATGGMFIPPHPHTGLQTVSWLFAGELEHRDSLGTHTLVRPGELNFAHVRRFVDRLDTVDDEEIVAALRWLFREAKIVAEPSGAVTVAAALRQPLQYTPPIVAVISGGNLDPAAAASYLL